MICFIGYATPPVLASTPISSITQQSNEDDIIAPPYSPISISNTSQQGLIDTSISQPCESSPIKPNGCTTPDNVKLLQYSGNSDWKGFIVVGDNIDKNVHARHQTIDSRNQSLHYFNSYAVRDRCNFSNFAEHHCPPDLATYDVSEFLPSKADFDTLIRHFSIFVARLLTTYVPGFAVFKSLCIPHIKHKYTVEMCQKSDVVSEYVLFVELIVTALGPS